MNSTHVFFLHSCLCVPSETNGAVYDDKKNLFFHSSDTVCNTSRVDIRVTFCDRRLRTVSVSVREEIL